MRAKYINEIKKSTEKSGLENLGIGNAKSHVGYDECVKLQHDLVQVLPLSSNYWNFKGALEKFPEKMASIYGTSADNLIRVSERVLNSESEAYLQRAFYHPDDYPHWPSEQYRMDTMELHWSKNDSDTMYITTNEKLNISYLMYTHRDNFVSAYVFRIR